MHTILLIDDDIGLTHLLSEYLCQQNYQVEVANTPELGLQMLKKNDYDALLLDVMMPSIDGFEALRQLRQFSSIPVIMLTAKGDDYDKILGLELGADDYLPKPFNHRELLARIKALLRRTQSQSSFVKNKLLRLHGIEIDEASHSASVDGHELVLTGTEFSMLVHLLKQAGQLLSKEQLSSLVLGRKLAPFDRSLDMHMSNVRKKLAEQGINDVIKTIRGSGYMMVAERE
ncbi:response regulator [Glaciecola siphonariae]|uniref:Response regulator n=1 Tax=Glaciecola siphonariae TaxID=521012 RepID=A0ABV9LZY5_9ALTE